ncbi:MAG TPA: DUF3443 domain-containing protein, partial [Janthinobacterium sp.]|nr:DUF3443 domain-containing protein [Janthinobacterium sp.]
MHFFASPFSAPLKRLAATGACLLLAACGGGSGSTSASNGASTPSAVTVSVALAPASVSIGQSSVLTWSSANAASCTASGAWSGSQATSGTLPVPQSAAGSYTYNLACTGAAGTTSASAALTVTVPINVAAITVDNGPAGAGGAINVPYVSVTVCRPGTSTCQTIDHVMLDTGSYGLRLIAPLSASLGLPAVTTPSGAAAAECGQFVSGYTWGSVRRADVKLGGETAPGIPIQVIGDTASPYGNAPSSCSATGSNLGTVANLGANGILGVGLFKQDCGSNCVTRAVAATYYSCTSSGNIDSCAASAMPLASQVGNPVAAFASDNNGVLLTLPAVATGGTTTLSGALIFGIGTQNNNSMASETVYKVSPTSGNFNTTYQGKTLSASFIDSGSNGYFFTDSTQRGCPSSTDFYCPLAPESLSAVNAAYDNSMSGTINFSIENIDNLDSSINVASVGGTNGKNSNAFDWGLPFFFGRRVFVVLEDATA